jgi:hypothetical protein
MRGMENCQVAVLEISLRERITRSSLLLNKLIYRVVSSGSPPRLASLFADCCTTTSTAFQFLINSFQRESLAGGGRVYFYAYS